MAAWKFRGDEIFAAFDEEEKDFVRFSCRFEVIERHIDVLSGLEKITVKIQNGYSNPQVTMPRETISEDTIVDELTKYGVSLSNEKEVQGLVKEILTDTEEVAPKILEFNKLGFVEKDGVEYFLGDKLYCATKTSLDGAVCAVCDMKSRGTLRQYRQFLLNEVATSPKIALAFALGVTAPVAYILKRKGAFYETLLWNFCGESSTGKTTSLLAMLSLFGCPQYLLSNLNATGNALAAQISAQSGWPFVADEATRSKLDFDELIYSLSSGKGKRRCNGDGSLKELVNFSGAAFFSSEQSILDKCSGQGGEEARVVEFELDWFDGDCAKAERVLRFINTHYGVGVSTLASLLLDSKIQKKIVRHFLRAQKELAKKVRIKDGVDKRILQRMAIVAVSCWLLEKAIKVDLHLSKIVDLLVKVFEDKQTRICRMESTEYLHQLFVEDFLHNREKYGTASSWTKSMRHANQASSANTGSQRGMLAKFQGRECLWLPTDVFGEILNRQCTYGMSTAKKKLHEKGLLAKFGNAYYRWYNFGPVSANAYCVFLPDHTETAHDAIIDEPDSSLKIESKPTLIAGFVSLTAQHTGMILNSELATKFCIKKKKVLFLHTWGMKEFLLLSSKPSESAIRLEFEKVDNVYVALSETLTTTLQASKLGIARRGRLLLTDIILSGEPPSAMIYIDNPLGQVHENIDENNPFQISQSTNISRLAITSQLSSLLADEK